MGSIIALLLPVFSTLITRFFPDPEKAAAANLAVQQALNEAQVEAYKAQAVQDEAKKDIITTEIGSHNLAGNWRSYLMLICVAIVGYNWILVSFLNAFLIHINSSITSVPVPQELWTLVTVGLGGYIGKETMQTYTTGKIEKARIENIPNDKGFYDILRAKVFKSGMTQEQVDSLHEALKARDTD